MYVNVICYIRMEAHYVCICICNIGRLLCM